LKLFGSLYAVGFGKCLEYSQPAQGDMTAGDSSICSSSAIVLAHMRYVNNVQASVTLSDSGVVDMGSFHPSLLPPYSPDRISRHEMNAAGCVTVYPRGVTLPTGSSYFEATVSCGIEVNPSFAVSETLSPSVTAVPLLALGVAAVLNMGGFPGKHASSATSKAPVMQLSTCKVGQTASTEVDCRDGIFLTVIYHKSVHGEYSLGLAVVSHNRISILCDSSDAPLSVAAGDTIGCGAEISENTMTVSFWLRRDSSFSPQDGTLLGTVTTTDTSGSRPPVCTPALWLQRLPVSTCPSLSATFKLNQLAAWASNGKQHNCAPERYTWLGDLMAQQARRLVDGQYGVERGKLHHNGIDKTVTVTKGLDRTYAVAGDTNTSVSFAYYCVLNSGKWYYECTVNTLVSTAISIGWAEALSTITDTRTTAQGKGFWMYDIENGSTLYEGIRSLLKRHCVGARS